MAAQPATGAPRDQFCYCALAVKRQQWGGKQKWCVLPAANPDAALALQLVPPGPEAHTAMVRAGLRQRGFTKMHLAVEGFGLDLAGLQRQVTWPGWFVRVPS